MIMRALFNADRVLRKCSDTYMEESAHILRESLPDYSGMVDRATVKLLTRTSIMFVRAREADASENLKIGSVRVSTGFTEVLFQ